MASSVRPIPLPEIPDLEATLRLLLKQIPAGRVATYGGLADALGSKTAARWVGAYLRDHEHTTKCNCHRVVRIDGSIGLFVADSSDGKRRKLISEGVPMRDGRVDIDLCRFADFESAHPLASLIDWQTQIAGRVRQSRLKSLPDVVAGLDVAYAAPGKAVGAYVLYDLRTNELLWSRVIERPAPFPYIPGLLTFRELPVFIALLEAASEKGRTADLLFVDGNGILHPRRSGIATSVGVVSGIPTIGVGKKLLCGKVEPSGNRRRGPGLIHHNNECIGVAIQSDSRSRPVFVSPGHQIDVGMASEIATIAFRGHRLPEPLFQADALSKRAAQKIRNQCRK